jgi:eukaryotic-like serine/threonine-protein kinase
MPLDSAAALVDALRDAPLLGPAQLEDLPALQANFSRPEGLAGELARRGWLTPYQAELLLRGRGKELVLGPYAVLDLLGVGGIGQVFNADFREAK